MIDQLGFWKGRDIAYASELTPEIWAAGEAHRANVNDLLGVFETQTGTKMSDCHSGWRPTAINDATSNAGHNSTHIIGHGEDVGDTLSRALARWVAANPKELEKRGLYCERFEWTPTWVHFQDIAPHSGHRFYVPSSAPALVARLPEQDKYGC